MERVTIKERMTAALMRRSLPNFQAGDHRVTLTQIDVPMSDGVILKADLLMPDRIEPGVPTVLIRTPYGRGVPFRVRFALPLATFGFPVLLQSTRGTFGSGGKFRPQLDEQRDGVDTLRWVRDQPWFTGHLATAGESYLGYTQWAVAGKLTMEEPEIAPEALSLAVTMPDFGAITWDHGVFALRNSLGWSRMMTIIEKPTGMLMMMGRSRKLERGFDAIPLAEGDKVATGDTIDWYQEWLHHEDLRDEYWSQQSHTSSVQNVTAPIIMTTGWHDLFLPWQIKTYETLAAAGRAPLLTIGPWQHDSTDAVAENLRGTIDLFTHHFLGVPSSRKAPVRFFLTGPDEWVDSATWPPSPIEQRTLFLRTGGSLETAIPPEVSASTSYTYDPNDATPSTGGPIVQGGKGGPIDDQEHEKRSDVIAFTSEALTDDLDVTGTPTATIWLRSDRPSADVFVRITDVHPDGRSMTVSDGIRRVGSPATAHTDPDRTGDGAWAVELELWPTAHRFSAGHRIRLQVSSGAHPRYARNPGTGRPAADDTELLVAHQAVVHEAKRVSELRLPHWRH